jgi:tripartite-type tricarboxylate transporter receptor subunit TctC
MPTSSQPRRVLAAPISDSADIGGRGRPTGRHPEGQEHGTADPCRRAAMAVVRSIIMIGAMIVIRYCLATLIAVAVLVLPALRGARAQDYPNRPVRLVVAFTPGGTTDFVARLLSEPLRSLLGQNVVVDNRPGANGAIGAEYVAKAEADGYTLFFTTVGAVAINPALRSNLPYDPVKDFAPVGMAVFNSTMLVVNASMPVNSARELAALARERPGAITIGVTGIGAVSHLGLELFQAAAGVKFQAVPYRGAAQAMTDLLGGQLDGLFGDTPTVMQQVKAGKLKALAATSPGSLRHFPGRADLRRARLPGYRRQPMGRHLGAGGHTARRHLETQRRFQRRADRCRCSPQAGAGRRHALPEQPGGVCPLSQGGDRPLEQTYPRERDQRRIGIQLITGTRPDSSAARR